MVWKERVNPISCKPRTTTTTLTMTTTMTATVDDDDGDVDDDDGDDDGIMTLNYSGDRSFSKSYILINVVQNNRRSSMRYETPCFTNLSFRSRKRAI